MKRFSVQAALAECQRGKAWLDGLRIPQLAANTGYFIVLSVFPALLLVLSGLRLTGLSVDDLLALMEGFLPQTLMSTARELIPNVCQNASGSVAGISALTALWSASRGVYGLLTGLNAVYGAAENRGWLYTRGISMLYTFALGAVILLTLVLSVFGNTLAALLRGVNLPGMAALLELLDLRLVFLLAVQSLVFTLMFMFLPNRRNRFLESLPGGLVASVGWLLFSNLYSVYVTHFPSYANIYGSVYGVAISMLWLYCCLEILFFGGALNRLIAGMLRRTSN